MRSIHARPSGRGGAGQARETAGSPTLPGIRLGSGNDLPELAALERAGFPPGRAWSCALLRMELHAPRSLVLVAEDRGEHTVLGYATFQVAGDEAELLRVTVSPEARRRGIGRALVEAGLAEARERGATRCFLEVRPDNRAAVALYRTLGFRETGRRPGYYRDGSDAVVMERP